MFSIFKDVNGKISAKRVSGFICLINAVVLSYVGGTEPVIYAFLGTMGAMLGVSVFEKFKNGD